MFINQKNTSGFLLSDNNNYSKNQFKQQTLSLLREQSNKLKLLNAQISSKQQQLSIKQQQLKFLKQTVMELQGQNELVSRQRDEMKQKLDKIVQQIQIYNQQVVKPICVQRQGLRRQNKQLKQKIQNTDNELKQLTTFVTESTTINESLQKQLQKTTLLLKQHQINNIQLQQSLSKQQSLTIKYKDQVSKLTKSLNEQSSIKQKLNVELGTVNKQLNTVINKYNTVVKDYQQKLKDMLTKKVDIQQITKMQQIIKTKQKDISILKQQIVLNNQLKQQYRLKSLTQRQKLSKQLTKCKLNYQQLKVDLVNLTKSIEMSRKIIQFQSQQSQIFYSIYSQYEKLTERNQQTKQSKQKYHQLFTEMKLQNQKLSQQSQNIQIEQTLVKTHFQEQLQRLQSQYQGKLLTLNLKIRHQQQALERIKKNQTQMVQHNQLLQKQLRLITAELTSYKSTTEQSLNKLNQENYKIVQQMQQLYQICSENLNNKRGLDKIKHVVHSLLIALYFMENKLKEHCQKETKFYLPMVEGFLQISKQLLKQKNPNKSSSETQKKDFSFVNTKKTNISPRKPKHISKIRTSIYAVIATIRLKNYLQKKLLLSKQKDQLFGVSLLVMRSLQTRNKIPNMVELLQKQSEIYSKSQQTDQIILQLLNVTNNAFTWPENKVQNLQVNTSKYLNIIHQLKINQ